MKKTSITLLLLLCLLSRTGYGQQAFAPLNATWNYSYGTDEYSGYTLQRITGDTIIAGITCREAVSTTYRLSLVNLSAPVDSSIVTRCYVTTGADTVLYYNTNFSRFLPLYIFNAAAGDTLVYHSPFIRPEAPDDTLFRVVVDSVSILTVDGTALKKVYNRSLDGWGFYGSASGSYTQLLGAEEGLAVHGHGVTTANITRPVIRCYLDNMIRYTRETGSTCEGMEGPNNITYLQPDTEAMEVFPVPARSRLHVQLKDPNDVIRSIRLTECSGRQVLFYTSSKAGYKKELRLGSLARGVYLIHVQTRDKQLARKITID